MALVLAVCMIMPACGLAAAYTPGTYTGTAKGHNGDVTVEVTFTENAIADVKVIDHKETLGLGYGVSTAAIDAYPAKSVESQSLAIDVVTNATVTSNAVLAAVADAVARAGGDAEVLKTPAEKQAGEAQVYDVDVVVVGAGTPWQEKQGYTDNADMMYEYLMSFDRTIS